jgi:hypothetical protein
MSECEHPWKKIEARDAGVIECVQCRQRWRGPAAEFVWRRAHQAIGELVHRLDKVTEAFDNYFKMWSCDLCGAYFPQQESKHGLNINGVYLCYGCAPEWLEKVGNRYDDDRDRRYARVRLARWLCEHWYLNAHTIGMWRALELEIIVVRKAQGKLVYAVH